MSTSLRHHRRFGTKSTWAASAFAGAAILGFPHFARAQAVAVTHIEEDWELVLNEPNNSKDSPQFHTVMSPVGNLDGFFAQVVWNYRELPDFQAGGLQLQSWNGEDLLRTRTVSTRELSTSAESITWTQSLDTDGSTLSFELKDGESTTWG